MLESLKSLWSRWRVQVSFVGGALVVATAYGTCTYSAEEVSEPTEEAPVQEVSAETSTVEETSTEAAATETTESSETTENASSSVSGE